MTIALPVAIGVAGACGALARWGVVRMVVALGAQSTWGTLSVNVVGSFLAGFLAVALKSVSPMWSAALMVGFLGAFTTFSTFTLETARLGLEGHFGLVALNLFLQNGLGLAAALLGLWVAREVCA